MALMVSVASMRPGLRTQQPYCWVMGRNASDRLIYAVIFIAAWIVLITALVSPSDGAVNPNRASVCEELSDTTSEHWEIISAEASNLHRGEASQRRHQSVAQDVPAPTAREESSEWRRALMDVEESWWPAQTYARAAENRRRWAERSLLLPRMRDGVDRRKRRLWRPGGAGAGCRASHDAGYEQNTAEVNVADGLFAIALAIEGLWARNQALGEQALSRCGEVRSASRQRTFELRQQLRRYASALHQRPGGPAVSELAELLILSGRRHVPTRALTPRDRSPYALWRKPITSLALADSAVLHRQIAASIHFIKLDVLSTLAADHCASTASTAASALNRRPLLHRHERR